MDECTSPGFLWGYGRPELKAQLALLQWNLNVRHTWTNRLMNEITVDEKREAVKQIEYVTSLLSEQSDRMIKISADN